MYDVTYLCVELLEFMDRKGEAIVFERSRIIETRAKAVENTSMPQDNAVQGFDSEVVG